ncbi:MAG TPA: DNA repair protein RecN [Flavobacteriales bacterium]|nr:DNA repair protein RecN [Flavobacteriales bacterium]
MLHQIYVRNYALIEELKLDFEPGFTAITGETGAGKSILLGALSLLLGERADSKQLLNDEKKCIVEGAFKIEDYSLESFFAQHELDFFQDCIIRREISPGGRSRAFINDTPVSVQTLRALAENLVDVHSQNENLSLNDSAYQLLLLDSFAGAKTLREEYATEYTKWKTLTQNLNEREAQIAELRKNRDYWQFQFDELEAIPLKRASEEGWEERIQLMENSEEIKAVLHSFSEEFYEGGLSDKLTSLLERARSVEGMSPSLDELIKRLKESQIELKDIGLESASLAENVEFNPSELQQMRDSMNQINSLLFKHSLQSVEELMLRQLELEQNLLNNAEVEEDLQALRAEIEEVHQSLEKKAAELRKLRTKAIPSLEKRLLSELEKLKMEQSALKFDLQYLDELNESGFDRVQILFDANRNNQLRSISKVASGGERSRLLLALRRVLAEVHRMPSIVFDEIDTGVSGDVALKVGQLMAEMSADCQIMSITHLPQIAGKASHHLHVSKHEVDGSLRTKVRMLSTDERIVEIAQMLSGVDPSQAALGNARELLSN